MELTVDELASRAGVTVRTVRFYAGRGLLPPPSCADAPVCTAPTISRGSNSSGSSSRSGSRSPPSRSTSRGFPGRATEDLALQRALLSPWAPEQPEDLDRHELDRRAGRHLDDETIKRLEALGVIEQISADVIRVVSPALLGISAELAELPMPLDTLIASHEAVDRHTTALAAELQQVFQDTVVRPYREGGRAPQERERLMEMAGS